MPARRDMHTGRMGFLHRSWGPLEPFDDSFPAMLGRHGVYSHLITDHMHYFRDGGATYHTQYTTFDFVRGQSGDNWQATVNPDWQNLAQKYHPCQFSTSRDDEHAQHILNREAYRTEGDYPMVKCVDAGLVFLEGNNAADDWFLQIETFDPHEPFCAPQRFREGIETGYNGPVLDWPPYRRNEFNPTESAELRANYDAKLAFCDEQLGRILDTFDRLRLWDDTMLVVSTDHGYLLGEHDWWAKNRMPCYEEIAHIPLFLHHPQYANMAGSRCDALTQTMDLAPTFLDAHGTERGPDMIGRNLFDVLNHGSGHEAALFGLYGGAVNVTDGRYIYHLYPSDMDVGALNQYTLMPMTLGGLFSPEELADAEMAKPFRFTKGARIMRIPVKETSPFLYNQGPKVMQDTGTTLYDLANDPQQLRPFRDEEVEARLVESLKRIMRSLDSPPEIYARLGLRTPRARVSSP